jgi:glyceraldehyde 3-phosphate dehydrogenase
VVLVVRGAVKDYDWGIVDGLATITSGNHAVVYVWYDNEYGYSHQVVRVLEKMGGVMRPSFPSRRGNV